VTTHSSKTNSTSQKEATIHHRSLVATQAASIMSPRSLLQRAVADPASAPPSEVLMLQRQYGNQAVQRLLAGHPVIPRSTAGNPVAQRLLARRAVQAKLSVGPAGDTYEQEADRVAEHVMTMPAGTTAKTPVQRQGEEEEIQTKPLAGTISSFVKRAAEEEEEVQTKREAPGAGFEAGNAIEDQLRAQKGSGSPLAAETRHAMESRFGANFSGVRIHADSQAAQLNRQLNAQAFTHGGDIYMGAGKYSPGSEAGQRLLAHELTHTLQQGAARLQRQESHVAEAGVIQRRLSDDASVTIDPAPPEPENDAAKIRTTINSNLDHVAASDVDLGPRSGTFDNAGRGDAPGQKIIIGKPNQELPQTIRGHDLTAHVVANMMWPRDSSHIVRGTELAAALDAKGTKDPRWEGLTFQGERLFISLGPDGNVITAFYNAGWSPMQRRDYEEFLDPKKKDKRLADERIAAAAERERTKKTKAAVATVRTGKAYLDGLIREAGLPPGGMRVINLVKLQGKLTNNPVTDLAMVRAELAALTPSKAKSAPATGKKGKK
jgi:hypothetical protein